MGHHQTCKADHRFYFQIKLFSPFRVPYTYTYTYTYNALRLVATRLIDHLRPRYLFVAFQKSIPRLLYYEIGGIFHRLKKGEIKIHWMINPIYTRDMIISLAKREEKNNGYRSTSRRKICIAYRERDVSLNWFVLNKS